MPDLTIEIMQQCDGEQHAISRTVKGSKGEIYKVKAGVNVPDCTCIGFKWTKKRNWRGDRVCKHIEAIEAEECKWHEMYGTAQSDWQEFHMICPDCGESTHYVQVGV